MDVYEIHYNMATSEENRKDKKGFSQVVSGKSGGDALNSFRMDNPDAEILVTHPINENYADSCIADFEERIYDKFKSEFDSMEERYGKVTAERVRHYVNKQTYAKQIFEIGSNKLE